MGEGHPGVMEYGDCYVFSFNPRSEKLRAVITDMFEPNGLALSPDEAILYVSESSISSTSSEIKTQHIRAYDVVDGKCKSGRIFATLHEAVPEGIKVDSDGNLWSATSLGVMIFNKAGRQIGKIDVPERTANLCFGGLDGEDIYIAAATSIYRLPKSSLNLST